MNNITRTHCPIVEADPKEGWRVVTRSPNSGRVLKVWAKQQPLKTAELLAQGITRGIKENGA